MPENGVSASMQNITGTKRAISVQIRTNPVQAGEVCAGSVPIDGRLDRILAYTLHCLREIRHTDHPGALSGDLALIWRRHLGPAERCLLLATAAQAADSENLEELGFILGGPPPLGGAL
jgi:hypothetical protein